MQRRYIRSLAGSVAVAVCMLGSAEAQEIPRSGEATVFWAHVNPGPFAPIPLGDGRTAAVATYITAAFNQTGAGLMHAMRARCVALLTSNPTAATLEVVGHCDYQDLAGDHIYLSFGSQGPQPLASIRTVGDILGGTGKYAGIDGTIAIRPYNQSTSIEGYVQFLGEMTVTYQLP